MDAINAVTFGYMSTRGGWEVPEARASLRQLQERTGINTVILAVVVEQATTTTPEISWQSPKVLSDEEVGAMIDYAHQLGLRVILKPMVNVSDGSWRAHINFFDHAEPCEPSWADWFENYNLFMVHYAQLAEQHHAEMLVIGCELVNTDRCEREWRELVALIRAQYHGLLTYNCDKYQEDALTWWDCLDVISSSGYYPINDWEKQLDRIEKVVKREQKPFFFCEAGCASRKNAELLPNDWTVAGEVDLDAQNRWYQEMFERTAKRSWVQGYGIWDWKANLYDLGAASGDTDYAIYGKPAEQTIKQKYILLK